MRDNVVKKEPPAAMIFALVDLVRYRFRLQHYGDDPSKNILALGHTHRVAEETLEILEPGDIIICQRMDSLLSWAIMYFGGRYAVDHAAIYVGNGKVVHATLSGVKEHSIHALARGARILPFRLYGWDEDDPEAARTRSSTGQAIKPTEDAAESKKEVVDAAQEPAGAPLPPHLQLVLAGLSIVLGLRPTSFRWQYYWDVGFIAGLLDLALWPINHFPMACTIWAAWLVVLVQMRVRYWRQLRAGRKFEPDSHPGLFVRLMWNRGGHIFPSQPRSGRWKVRVWPAWQVLSSLQQTAHQSPSRQSDLES